MSLFIIYLSITYQNMVLLSLLIIVEDIITLGINLKYHCLLKICLKLFYSLFLYNHYSLLILILEFLLILIFLFCRDFQVFSFIRSLIHSNLTLAYYQYNNYIESLNRNTFFLNMLFELFQRIFLDLQHQDKN